ncbi:MAG: AbrB/MazE/SpoVT family DNA-binding domain-containing protein [Arcobacteraceae bacterium]|jgi:antitoxin MazE|nr:AbrB/MazE/SpoVT family DNA-binding domain-containing protein [Arcobacteraceae bacterium]
MTATISSWGNSQGLRFPKNILEELHLGIGDKVKVLIENQKIIIEPIKEPKEKYDINELVSQIPLNYKISEEFNHKIGIEEW